MTAHDTCITNSRRRGIPLSDRRTYSGSFSFLACWIWARRLMGFIPWPYSGPVWNRFKRQNHYFSIYPYICFDKSFTKVTSSLIPPLGEQEVNFFPSSDHETEDKNPQAQNCGKKYAPTFWYCCRQCAYLASVNYQYPHLSMKVLWGWMKISRFVSQLYLIALFLCPKPLKIGCYNAI